MSTNPSDIRGHVAELTFIAPISSPLITLSVDRASVLLIRAPRQVVADAVLPNRSIRMKHTALANLDPTFH